MRIKIFLVAAILAAGGVLAAMAYNVASINQEAKAAVVSTEDALLALSCKNEEAAGNKDETCRVGADGLLHLDFTRSLQIGTGFQPRSEYEFDDLVIVHNNSNETVEVTVDTGEEGSLFHTNGLTVTMRLADSTYPTLPAGETTTISFEFALKRDVELTEDDDLQGEIIVRAVPKGG